jgi:N-acetylglucosamine-6-phosphate deacetylase
MARDLLVENGRFAAIVERNSSVSTDWQQIDATGKVLFPGIIDLLQHGLDVNLYNDTADGAVAHSSLLLLARGTTAFLPSISCLARGTLEATLKRLSDQTTEAKGARALGVHSEGPCFGSPGAHNIANISMPSVELAQAMLSAADGRLKAVTVAPELPGAEGFIRALKAAGVSIHFGHSRARAADISKYVSWGIDAVTHMYNVMPTEPPGTMGLHIVSLTDALMAERHLALGLICDGIHVDPILMRLLAQLPRDRVFLETDANKFAGSAGAQDFEFYPGYWVTSAPGKAVVDREGGLCGSSLTPEEALRNYVALGVDLTQAAHAASLVPARVIGVESEMGSIEVGKLADFVVLDAGTLVVDETVVGGKSLYRRAA